MHKVAVKRRLDIPAESVWNTLDKFADVSNYHPQVKHSQSINEITTGQGAERTCLFEDGNRINERIIKYEKGAAYDVDIYDAGSFPLKKAVGRMQVSSLSPDSSEVLFSMSFIPKFGFIGWLMARVMMKKQFAKILASVLEGLERHLLTGQIITKNSLKAKAA